MCASQRWREPCGWGWTAEVWQPLMSHIQVLSLSGCLCKVMETGDKALQSLEHEIENDSSEYS